MLHDVFGEIKYDYLWTKNYEFRIFGETSVGILNIAGEVAVIRIALMFFGQLPREITNVRIFYTSICSPACYDTDLS